MSQPNDQTVAASAIPVWSAPTTFTNVSGAIAAGGTSQLLNAANSSRRKIIIQNPLSATDQGISTAENLYVNFSSVASAAGGSYILAPGDKIILSGMDCTTESINIYAATTGHRFTALVG